MARSIDNTASSLMPLTSDEERERLDRIVEAAQMISQQLSVLYNGIALRAFGPESAK